MIDIVKKVIEILEEHANPKLRRPFYDGDPIAIPTSMFPAVAVELSGSDIDTGPTSYDKHLDTLMIKVIVDKKQDFNKLPGEVVAQNTLRDFVKGVDENDALKADSIVGILRKHLSLDSSALEQLISIEFSVVKREDITTEEAWILFSVESNVQMLNRE